MRSLRTLLISGAVTALAVTALGTPVAAADTKGTLAIVNGIPGRKLDVCLNGKEIRSGLRYGGRVLKNVVPTGDKKLKFFRPDPRTCRGNLLAQKQFPLPPAGDLTIVATRDAPRVVIFDNAPLGEIPPLGDPTDVAPYAIRHAADVAADIDYRFWTDPGLQPVVPSGIFIKGQESASNDVDSGFVADVVVRMRASVVGGADVIVSPLVEAFVSHRYEWVLVGTKDANARWVFIDRIVSRPSP